MIQWGLIFLMALSLIDKKVRYFKDIGYQPGKKQWQIHEALCKYRFVLVRGGNRSGKSRTAGCEGAFAVHRPNTSIWCVAPTYDLTDKVYRIIYNEGVIKQGLPLFRDQSSPPYIKTMINSQVWGKSTEKLKSLEGEGVYLMLIDEFGFMNKNIWYRLMARLDQEGSKCLIIFTPKGKNIFPRQFWNEKEQDPHWFTIVMPTDEVEYVSKQFLEDAERELGGKQAPAYKEQIRGEFVPYGTLIYPMFGEHNLKIIKITKKWKFVVGIDVGFVHPTAAAFWAISPGDICYKFAEYHKSYLTQKDNAIAILEMIANYIKQYAFKEVEVYYPPEEPSFAKDLKKASTRYNFSIRIKAANNAVDDGIELIRRLLPTQIKINPICKNTIFNYQNYSHKPDSELIQKVNDDHCDADRYALCSHYHRTKTLFYKAY
ncbi:MAG TPA: hypothetical protein ENI52_03945 [Thermoplasmata archaeon]|nr:hypothetical protein [Thermoplasmata archaeon]